MTETVTGWAGCLSSPVTLIRSTSTSGVIWTLLNLQQTGSTSESANTAGGRGNVLCRKCGVIIAADWPGEYHVGCWPDFEKMPGFDMSGYDLELREEFIDVIQWASNNSARSRQVALGVSEVGAECDLRLAYKMAAVPDTGNNPDPWPSIVGTAVHTWLQQAIEDFEHVHSTKRWLCEMKVVPSPLVQGHTDLYDQQKFAVLDFKIPSPDNLKKMKLDGPSLQYMIQVQLYGLGHVNAGRRVDRVGIVALGRSGWLKDLWVHTVPFDREVAENALQRIYDLGGKMLDLRLPEEEQWHQIPRVPTRLCTWCPWFSREAKEVTSRGCPGHRGA